MKEWRIMKENDLLLIISILIHMIDCFMFYNLCYKLNNNKRLKLSLIPIIISLLYGIFISVLDIYISEYTYRIITTFLLLLIAKAISKKRVYDLFIVYVIIFLCIAFLQIIITIFTAQIPSIYTPLFIQTYTLIVIMLLCRLPIHNLLLVIEKEILLKLFIFITMGIYMALFSYFNFQYEIVGEYTLYFASLIFITLFGFYQTLKIALYYTNKMPMELHDVKNLLIGVQMASYSTTDIKEVRSGVDQCLNILSMDINEQELCMDSYNKSIQSLIYEKKAKGKMELSFVTDITYEQNYKNISFGVIIYMLGTLLDNAIETNTKKPIYIKLRVSDFGIYISVSNECQKKTNEDFQKMFKKGYSTKNGQSRGYGLFSLSNVVKMYNGEILVDTQFDNKHECHYLSISIEI